MIDIFNLRSFLHLSINSKKINKPIFALGFIKFFSIIFFEDISKQREFFFEKLCISLRVVSPTDLFGLLTILSKARSSFS